MIGPRAQAPLAMVCHCHPTVIRSGTVTVAVVQRNLPVYRCGADYRNSMAHSCVRSRPLTTFRVLRSRPTLVALTALVALSCGDPTAPRGDPGIHFVAGAGATDTTFSVLTQALIVEVRDSSGHLVPAGTIVRFQSALTEFINEAMVSELTASAFFNLVALETDQTGRAAVIVRLGPKAGPARVIVTVPTLGMRDTASYTVLPGNPANIVITPVDTMLYAGNSVTLTARVRDSWGNERTDDIRWTAHDGPGVTVTNAGVVSGSSVGRYMLTAAVGSISQSAHVSVVPQFRLVAWQTVPTSSIVSLNLDGSDRRVLASVTDGGIGAHPQWVPGTTTVIYSTLEIGTQRLRVVDENGASTPFLSTLPTGMSHQAEAAPTADGNWMFFSAFNEACNTADYCLHRATAAGGSPTLLETTGFPSRQPAPSPDGALVAFVRDPFSPFLQVMNAATGEVLDWVVNGSRPSWSPQGTTIAYLHGGRISTINPDGSGQTTLTPTEIGRADSHPFWDGPIRWSPGGEWIIARYDGVLALVEVATRKVMPLPGTAHLLGGSLR